MLQDISTQTFAIAQREAAYYCNLYSLLINGAAAYITANLFPCVCNCYISDSSLHATCCKMVTAAHDRISPLTASPQHRFANPGFWPQQTAVSRLALSATDDQLH